MSKQFKSPCYIKNLVHKKNIICIFLKCDLQIVSNKNHKTSGRAFFLNASCDVSGFLIFLKKSKITNYVPPSAINGDRLRTFVQKYFLAKLAIKARQLYIYVMKKKNLHHHGFMTKVVTFFFLNYLFVKISLNNHF